MLTYKNSKINQASHRSSYAKSPHRQKASQCILLIVISNSHSRYIDRHHNNLFACRVSRMFRGNQLSPLFFDCIKQQKESTQKQVNKPVRNCVTNLLLFAEKRSRKKRQRVRKRELRVRAL
jgi:hypothetical protein